MDSISSGCDDDACGCSGCVPKDNVGQLHQHSGSAVGREILGGAGSEIGGTAARSKEILFDDVTMKTIGEDMAQLSVQERNDVFEEIHGVDNIKEETPEFVDDQINKMKEEITKIVHKEAYNKAYLLAPTRVHNQKFLLMFLRSTKFNPKTAASKIVCYFQWKLKLFGSEKLAKDIKLAEDYSEDDMAALKTGSTQYIGQDTSGRAIILICMKFIECKEWINQQRASWYNCMVALEDEEVQKKGFVFIAYEVGMAYREAKYRKERMENVSMYQDALPLKVSSIHYCYSDSSIRTILTFFVHFANKSFRIRLRDHFGGHMECQYALLSFGVSPDITSIDRSGNLKKGMIDAFIAKRMMEESQKTTTTKDSSSTSSSGIEVATDKDVLFGRGKPYQNHPGNVQLKKLIGDKREEFSNASKFQKTVISWEIVKMMQNEYQARFLERDEVTGQWKVCEDEAARIKVAYGFRARSSSSKPPPQPPKTATTRPPVPQRLQQQPYPQPVNRMSRTVLPLQFTNWGFPQQQQPTPQQNNGRKSHLNYSNAAAAVDQYTKRHRAG